MTPGLAVRFLLRRSKFFTPTLDGTFNTEKIIGSFFVTSSEIKLEITDLKLKPLVDNVKLWYIMM